jgi:sulfur-oxidizing protein SoxY
MTFRLARREVVAGAAALATLGGFGGGAAAAPTPHYAEALAAFLDGREPATGGIVLETPEVAENGNMVAVSIDVDSPMTEGDHVRQVVLLATRNPVALVARYHFTPLSGRAFVASRMRLAETQDVVAMAELSDGSLRRATRLVRVTVGGCGAA